MANEQSDKPDTALLDYAIAYFERYGMTRMQLGSNFNGLDVAEAIKRARAPLPELRKPYDIAADAVQEVADAAAEAFRKAGIEPNEWDGDDIVKDVGRGIASDIERLARLRDASLAEIRHVAWHFLDDGEQRMDTNELVFDLPNADYDKLCELVGEGHPEPAVLSAKRESTEPPYAHTLLRQAVSFIDAFKAMSELPNSMLDGRACEPLLREITEELASSRSTTQPIGVVVGHQAPGVATVRWLDDGFRPVGMRVFNGDQAAPLSARQDRP